MTADAREIRKFGGDLTQLGLRAHDMAVKAVQKTAADITATAKSKAPVDTGNLKNSIGYNFGMSGGEIYAEIGPTAEYGIYQEFGTSKMAPQPFLTPAFDKHVPAFEKAMNQIIDKGL